ncbi:MAG: hypothetical protein Q8781_01715 [Candidatus Phytoplasma stylosanthis]|uniref:hypothetical protein n=1 Tax=Candidatus Phytoplasma stylosanthis TaxID=2798314 RepID=UPI00293ABFCE|nr:hypothetical protein [Candidatus Phytoplasma stylosanthis]MDV3168060.1 hypothetical protein [Candidatus Phytoplasma stylosanthis]MDV3171002.1 hypothetical protein [Candidatus Phytoplasma stylosanthis]MDV3202502.1 hypothetical protein [Candidatus Phytoplasma stylosanthis]
MKKNIFYKIITNRPYLFGTCKLLINKQIQDNFKLYVTKNVDYNKESGNITIYCDDLTVNNKYLFAESYIQTNPGFLRVRELFVITFQIYLNIEKDFNNEYKFNWKVKKK